MNTKLIPVAIFAVTLAAVSPAAADPPPAAPSSEVDVCSDSYEHAQEQMRPGQAESKLLRARESLRTCLRSNCKGWIVADCSKWLSEVESRIPTVVFSARTGPRDLTNVRVLRPDGTVVVEQLDGRALEMEPGIQQFVFVQPDGTRVEKQALVREGDKSQNITALFEVVGPEPPRPGETPAEKPRTTSSLRYVGFGLGGAGVLGVGLGTIFGLTAISKKNAADCDANNLCDQATLDDASSAATISTVAFVAGVALLAAGVTLVLLNPSTKTTGRVEARISAGGVGIGGSW